MIKSKYIGMGLVLVLLFAGGWLLFRTAGLAPETTARQEAVQLALAPGRISANNGEVIGLTAVGEDITLVRGNAVRPAIVNMQDVPSGPAAEDRMKKNTKQV